MARTNDHGQPIGDDLGGWTSPAPIDPTVLEGRTVKLEPIERTRHAIPLFHAFKPASESLWTYMPWGPFADAAELGQLFSDLTGRPDWVPYATVVDNELVGFLCYLRMDPTAGVIEIGGISHSPALQRSTASTEAIYLMIDQAFEVGYRRVEWKCDSLNAASCAAAKRLGFSYEGTFAKATHYKGRNRDTAWFAIVDDDWPKLRSRLLTWLDPANFDEDGSQRRRLEELLIGR
ncbi:MAG: GNAT family N-acetyltransferase [Acidimicrobiales bacterium]